MNLRAWRENPLVKSQPMPYQSLFPPTDHNFGRGKKIQRPGQQIINPVFRMSPVQISARRQSTLSFSKYSSVSQSKCWHRALNTATIASIHIYSSLTKSHHSTLHHLNYLQHCWWTINMRTERVHTKISSITNLSELLLNGRTRTITVLKCWY